MKIDVQNVYVLMLFLIMNALNVEIVDFKVFSI